MGHLWNPVVGRPRDQMIGRPRDVHGMLVINAFKIQFASILNLF